jgi:ABC-type Fe3+ transport system permease subunit
MTLVAVSDFWGGDGDTTLAVLAVIVMVILCAIALWQARTFVKKI